MHKLIDSLISHAETTALPAKDTPSTPQVETTSTPCDRYYCDNYPNQVPTSMSILCSNCLKDSNQLSDTAEQGDKGLPATNKTPITCTHFFCNNSPTKLATAPSYVCTQCHKDNKNMNNQELPHVNNTHNFLVVLGDDFTNPSAFHGMQSHDEAAASHSIRYYLDEYPEYNEAKLFRLKVTDIVTLEDVQWIANNNNFITYYQREEKKVLNKPKTKYCPNTHCANSYPGRNATRKWRNTCTYCLEHNDQLSSSDEQGDTDVRDTNQETSKVKGLDELITHTLQYAKTLRINAKWHLARADEYAKQRDFKQALSHSTHVQEYEQLARHVDSTVCKLKQLRKKNV